MCCQVCGTPARGSQQQFGVVCFNGQKKRNKRPPPAPSLCPENKGLSFLFQLS